MDVHDKKTRSFNMSRIMAKDTKPEMLVRRSLHSQGFRFRLHDVSLPGKPDIVLPKYRTVIQIHGCFWHGHEGCRYFSLPQTRTEWWRAKIQATKERDKRNFSDLRQSGWKVIVVWECELKPKVLQENINRIADMIRNG